MKRIILLLLLASSFTAQAQRKYIANKMPNNGVAYDGGLVPGDTIVLQASKNPYSYVSLGPQAKGISTKKIVIVPEGDVILTAGFDITGQHIKVAGGGRITIIGPGGSALTVKGKGSFVEFEGINIHNSEFGMWIKNEIADAPCDTSVQNHVIDSIIVHNCHFRNIYRQGGYIGSTDESNGTRKNVCNGKQVNARPTRIGNLMIYDCSFDGTGRAAIQVSNASIGLSRIYNNVIRNAGREYNNDQGPGIAIGFYSRAYVHDNYISNTFTWGLASLGATYFRAERNIVDSSGYLDGRRTDWAWNIVYDNRVKPVPDSVSFIIRDNTVGARGQGQKESIYIGETESRFISRTGNVVCGNKAVSGGVASFTVKPNIPYTDTCTSSKPPTEPPAPGSPDDVIEEIILQIRRDGTIKIKRKETNQ